LSGHQALPGLWSLSVPLPFEGLDAVRVYAIEADDGLILVDMGWGSRQSLRSLKRGLTAIGFSLDDVRGVLFTHAHDDHYGLAAAARQGSGAWLALHRADAVLVERRLLGSHGSRSAVVAQWLEEAGWPDAIVPIETGERDFPLVAPDRFLTEGDRLAIGRCEFVVMHTPGHSPGHVCFVDAGNRVVLTGDHVLAGTTPHVAVMPGGPANPLYDYLASLERTCALGDMLGLPGHGDTISSVGMRAREILEHHEEQLAHATACVATGANTTLAVAERMPWSRPWSDLSRLDRFLALGEAQAHLVALEGRGWVRRVDERPFRWIPV
jgi:glyoxylase-like metal-dependent hydrolase (beta-lactamase superfamily II)